MAMQSLFLFKQEWFKHTEWWFETRLETDAYLAKTYGHLLDENLLEYSWEWSVDTIVAWVLLYDQLPRHLARATSKNVIYTYLSKAIGLVKLVIEDGLGMLFDLGDFTGEEFGFLMLPLRHSYDCKMTYLAMEHTWKKLMADKMAGQHKYVEALKPFLIATYKRCPMLPLDTVDQYTYRDYFQYFPAAETAPCVFDWDNHSAVIAYTPEMMFDGEHRASNDDEWVSGWKIPVADRTLLVSLSGGVDSMVLLWILVKRYPNVPVMAVYINYCNRPDNEEAFVRDWCRHLSVRLCVRRIREIQRVPAMTFELRETYETYTKNCRMHAYHQANGFAVAADGGGGGEGGAAVVAMGHNQDDCFENILTNICQKQKYENLCGMTTLMEMEASGVTFWRPMLHVPKQRIYQYAQKHGIPYLHDSTPAWSCRGKIRDVVRPTLEHYHSAMIPAFFHLSETMTELTQHLEHFAKTLHSKIQDNRLSIQLSEYPSSLWTSVRFWQYFFQTYKSICPSHKSLGHLCERMRALVDTDTGSVSASHIHIKVLLKKNVSLTVMKSADALTFAFVVAE